MRNVTHEELKKLTAVGRTGLEKVTELTVHNTAGSRLVKGSKKRYTETAMADLKTGEIVVKSFIENFGHSRILVEENAPPKIDYNDWDAIIDPVDCTRGFIHNLPGIGIGIALLHKGDVVASVIGQLQTDTTRRCFLLDIISAGRIKENWQTWHTSSACAWHTDGSLHYTNSTHTETQLQCAHDISLPTDCIFYIEKDAFDTSQSNFADVRALDEAFMPPSGTTTRAGRMFGSSSLGFFLLARGSIHIFTGSRKPWDFLPGLPLVTGAGAKYFFYKDTHGVSRVCAVVPGLEQYAKEVHRKAGMKILEEQSLSQNFKTILPSA